MAPSNNTRMAAELLPYTPHERDYSRGICMWSPDGEWCAKPTIVEDIKLKTHMPSGGTDVWRWGAFYILIDRLNPPEYGGNTHFWVCDNHMRDFVALNDPSSDIWRVDASGNAELINPQEREFRVAFTLTTTEMQNEHTVSSIAKLTLRKLMQDYPDFNGWHGVAVEELSAIAEGGE